MCTWKDTPTPAAGRFEWPTTAISNSWLMSKASTVVTGRWSATSQTWTGRRDGSAEHVWLHPEQVNNLNTEEEFKSSLSQSGALVMQRGAEMQDQKLWTEFSNSTMLQQPGDLLLDTGKWELIMCRELNCFPSKITWICCYFKDRLNVLPSEQVLYIITMTCKGFKGPTCNRTCILILQRFVWILAESLMQFLK